MSVQNIRKPDAMILLTTHKPLRRAPAFFARGMNQDDWNKTNTDLTACQGGIKQPLSL